MADDAAAAERRAVTDLLDALDRSYSVSLTPFRDDACAVRTRRPDGGVEEAAGPGQPRIGTSSVTVAKGTLTKPEIKAVITRALRGYTSCYEQRLVHVPYATGIVRLEFMISGDGRVAYVRVLENTVDTQVAECAQAITSTLRFPPPRGAGVVIVTYPFMFGSY